MSMCSTIMRWISTLQSANRLMKKNCYRALVNLRDAYHSVPIDEEHYFS